jgi:hypothetical protein
VCLLRDARRCARGAGRGLRACVRRRAAVERPGGRLSAARAARSGVWSVAAGHRSASHPCPIAAPRRRPRRAAPRRRHVAATRAARGTRPARGALRAARAQKTPKHTQKSER